MHHVLLVSALCLVACGGSGDETPAAAPVPQEPAAVSAASLPVANAAVLAEADLMDGDKDKVVSQCGLCSLFMEGDAAHAVQAGEYTLHMCSAECKDAWEKDPVASMAALEEAVK
jgi:hypothetical protein